MQSVSKCEFNREIKNPTPEFKPRINIFLSKNGDILRLQTDHEILERWRKHFDGPINNKYEDEYPPCRPLATAENSNILLAFDESIVALKNCEMEEQAAETL